MIKQVNLTQAQVEKLAITIAKVLQSGDIIELIGDVGAGKTTFTKALARSLGVSERVQSPTFTISNRYKTSHEFELIHYDFYRLHDAGIMTDELNEAVLDGLSIVVVEWGDIVSDVLPRDRITIHFTVASESTRDVAIKARTSVEKAIA